MKPPNEIYLQVKDDSGEKMEEITWCEDKINDTDIEYIRAEDSICSMEQYQRKHFPNTIGNECPCCGRKLENQDDYDRCIICGAPKALGRDVCRCGRPYGSFCSEDHLKTI